MSTGVVTATSPATGSATLDADVTALDDVLPVDDAAVFAEDYSETRYLVIGDETTPREYIAVQNDEELGQETVTLADPLGADFEAGLPVTPWDPNAPATDKRAVEHKVWLRLDGQDGTIRVTVPHNWIPVTGLDGLVGAGVRVAETVQGSRQWSVAEVFGREAVIDGTTVASPYIDGYLNTAGVDMSIPTGTSLTPIADWAIASSSSGWTIDGTGRVVPPKPGRYLFAATSTWATNGTGARHFQYRLAYTDGSYSAFADHDTRPAASILALNNHIAGTVLITEGQGIQFSVYQTSGAALDLVEGHTWTRFSLFWVSDA